MGDVGCEVRALLHLLGQPVHQGIDGPHGAGKIGERLVGGQSVCGLSGSAHRCVGSVAARA